MAYTNGEKMKFNIIKEIEVQYGKNSFIQISKTEAEGKQYLSIAKGMYIMDKVNKKRYLKNVTFPIDADVFPQKKREYEKLPLEVIKAMQEVLK